MESHEKEQNRSKIALSSSSPLFVTPTPTTLLFERRLHRLYHPILLLQTCTITDRLLARNNLPGFWSDFHGNGNHLGCGEGHLGSVDTGSQYHRQAHRYRPDADRDQQRERRLQCAVASRGRV